MCVCGNRDVKVNVKPEKDERPLLRGAGFMRRARRGSEIPAARYE